MAIRTAKKQPEEKMARGTPVKRGGLAITVERRGISAGLPRASKPPLAPCPVEDHTGEKTALRGLGPRGQTLKTIGTEGAQGSPHELWS